MSEETKIVLDVRKLYVDNLSIEVPHAPAIFQKELNPQVALHVAHEVVNLPEDDYYAVSLRLTVTATNEEENVYLIEVSQGGVFFIQGLNEVQLHHALNVYCPTTLYPYAREVISNAMVRAGFPVLFLQPVNFEMLYQERLEELLKEQGGEGEAKADAGTEEK